MNIVSKMKDLLKRCKQGNNPNELPLSDDTRKLMSKPIEVLIDDLVRISPTLVRDPSVLESAKTIAEVTRRLIIELRNFNKSTARLNYILITLTIVLVFLAVVQILLMFKHH
jgi:hypothetical protein